MEYFKQFKKFTEKFQIKNYFCLALKLGKLFIHLIPN